MNGDTCEIDGCEKRSHNLSRMCSMHRARVARHGDPDFCLHQRDRNLPRGEDSPAWNAKGSYQAVHQRLRRQFGRARDHTCVDCQCPAWQWSLDDRTAEGVQSSKEGPFSTDLSQYVPRCVPCHKRHDLKALAS